ncbi:3-oxoacyl-[acyl-carrier-protein] reductase FabG-like [Anticarsia gemmatalis]|uniref:3-oxoacyl-[acyl-carrier-protein] reductase FabG-like n=1 Tax=Anticarsia gemmatalis TaxID=129554 RepID=UPI003F76DC19
MFSNKVVLITGGGSGIGAGTAECFAKEGANIAIVGRTEANLRDVAKRCENHGAKVLVIKADISKQEEVETIVKQTVDRFGKLDVLVNNAGILKIATINDGNMMAVYDDVMNTNLRAAVQLTHLAAPHLKETKGSVTNVSSIASKMVSNTGISAYSISKAGMDHFTKFAAAELSPFDVRVNAVNPGPVATKMIHSGLPEDLANKIQNAGREAQPEEVGDLIMYLSSDKAKSVTGSCVIIDGGFTLL